MNFGQIMTFILFGGGDFMIEAHRQLKTNGFDVVVFSSPRRLEEIIKGEALQESLVNQQVTFYSTEDINKEQRLEQYLSDETIGLSLGAPWLFKSDLLKKMSGRFINMHGMRLPEDRGGGGFSWQIMMRNKLGCNLIHQIDEGVDTGAIVTYNDFVFPDHCKIPQDYYDYHRERNIDFFNQFLIQVKQEESFKLTGQPEYLSTYWPRLNTNIHGFINWTWKLDDILNFIRAFDNPYPGASTFLKEKKVNIKSCSAHNSVAFHPFQSGMVYRKSSEGLFVATSNGTLIIRKIISETGQDILDKIKVGDRFYTPTEALENALKTRSTYTPTGLKK